MSSNRPHIPVLLDEVVESFSSIKKGYFVDCTLGYAGHSKVILEKYPQVDLIGIDRDIEALEFSKRELEEFNSRIELYRGSFSSIFSKIKQRPIVGVLADFGVSSLQLDKENRGFSFNSDSLDMRMDIRSNLKAEDIVNGYTRSDLEYIFKEYAQIREYKRLANAIVEHRAKKPIKSAKELAQLIAKVLPKTKKIHPATLPFQAIRIEVNSELKEIETLLNTIEKMAKEGNLSRAIVSFITFHSLEDKLVKNRFKLWAKKCICSSDMIRCECGGSNDLGKYINKKPITASKEELKYNIRSRSAKLRSFLFY